jgi:hypothetical protein
MEEISYPRTAKRPSSKGPANGIKLSAKDNKIRYDISYNPKANNKNYQEHLDRIQDAGIKWVRLEAADAEAIEYASQKKLNVIAIVKSKTALKDAGVACQCYCPNCDWGDIWKEYIAERVRELGPFGVKIWQVDNELNHPLQNPLPAGNIELAMDIIKIGAETIRTLDPTAKIAVNLNYCPIAIDPAAFISKFKSLRDDESVPLDILGMDYYKGGWGGVKGDWGDLCPGKPKDYPIDIDHHHELWLGDMMIMETGFCTAPIGDTSEINTTKECQRKFVNRVFYHMDEHIENCSWFKGIIWYEYHSKHDFEICEDYFGLHYIGGLEEDKKPAWDDFVSLIEEHNQFNKILGIQYHCY